MPTVDVNDEEPAMSEYVEVAGLKIRYQPVRDRPAAVAAARRVRVERRMGSGDAIARRAVHHLRDGHTWAWRYARSGYRLLRPHRDGRHRLHRDRHRRTYLHRGMERRRDRRTARGNAATGPRPQDRPVSTNFHTIGLLPEARTRFEGLTAESPALEHFRATYEAVSPDGAAHWPEIVDKVKTMILCEPTLTAQELSAIEAPTLVVSGDDDITSLEHTIEMMRSIPNAELAIVPGTSHFLLHEKSELTWTLIRDFLLYEPTPTMMPMRRAHG